jgi:hypothetical protein
MKKEEVVDGAALLNQLPVVQLAKVECWITMVRVLK